MNITKESLKAFNAQRENTGNNAYRKNHKLGNSRERVILGSIKTSIYGLLGGHRELTVKQVSEYGHKIIK